MWESEEYRGHPFGREIVHTILMIQLHQSKNGK